MTEQKIGVTDVVDRLAAPLDLDAFRDAMASFPTGVTIVSTVDDLGFPHGLTASSFCSVSLRPPLVSFCVATSANCYPAFARCERFAVNILRPQHAALALRFASKRPDKFTDSGFRRTPSGLLVFDDALSILECRVYDRYPGGDHSIVVGEVLGAHTEPGTPLVYVDRTFTRVTGR
ncbi:flavin reductase family protein [Micromonospora sp. KC213]|uniref:flavin reductase family protein n=1 Tax=Micromonospora sp. KC213 TaxID=2530378 RepID=UPI001FB57555|nr:flavin reductase family protein [Micromonospora sp. KC213]